MKKHSTLLFFVIATIFLLANCSETRKLNCPDGVTRTPYRNPGEQFPKYATQYNEAVKITLHIMDSVELSADAALRSKIVEFRDKLDQSSAIVESLIKSNYDAYNNNICDKDVRDKYYVFEKLLIDRIFQLQAANAELKALTDLKSLDEQSKLLNIMELTVNQTNSIVMANDPSSDTTAKTKKHIVIFVKYHEKYIDNSNMIYNGIVKAFTNNTDFEFEYLTSQKDFNNADYGIEISSNAIDDVSSQTWDDNSCEYVYTFTLFKIDKQSGKTSSVAAEFVKTKHCKVPSQEEDVATNFKNVSDSLIEFLARQ